MAILLLSVSIMLFSGRLLGELFVKLRQPSIIGEILAGVILGPSILGFLMPSVYLGLFTAPGTETVLDGITGLAVSMLMLVLGLEVDLPVVLRNKKIALSVSLLGMAVPLLTGGLLAYQFPEFFGPTGKIQRAVFALFIGTALSISALPVIARTLMDLKLFKTRLGIVIIASAMFGDLAGWMLFSFVLSLSGSEKGGFNPYEKIFFVILFSLAMLILARKWIDYLLLFLHRHFSYPGSILTFIFVLGFLSASLTEYIGVHAILGAFLAGIAIGDSVHLKEELRETIQQFVTNIFAPLFFVSIGLRINFIQNFEPWSVLTLIALATFGKVLGSGLGAYIGGLGREESLAVGFGMNSRGAMEIILGLVALQSGLIKERLFVALVIMALVTSITSAPLMSYFLNRKRRSFSESLIRAENVLFTDFRDKSEAIDNLCKTASRAFRLDEAEIIKAVTERENLSPTGIENSLALPHGRINTAKPKMLIAVNKSGLNFGAQDGIPSRIIILLLTPRETDGTQLKLLSEFAKAFDRKEDAVHLGQIRNSEEFAQKFKGMIEGAYL